MHDNLEQALTLADVCRNTGASVRSVNQAFRESVGVSPMAYLKILRLNRVHATLTDAEGGPVFIADVANEFGFWHLGQFARDYRELFGELPSDTLSASGRGSR